MNLVLVKPSPSSSVCCEAMSTPAQHLCAESSQALLSSTNSTGQTSTQHQWGQEQDGLKCPTSMDKGHPMGLWGQRPSLLLDSCGSTGISCCHLLGRLGWGRGVRAPGPVPHHSPWGFGFHRLTSGPSLQLSELIEETQPRQTRRREGRGRLDNRERQAPAAAPSAWQTLPASGCSLPAVQGPQETLNPPSMGWLSSNRSGSSQTQEVVPSLLQSRASPWGRQQERSKVPHGPTRR